MSPSLHPDSLLSNRLSGAQDVNCCKLYFTSKGPSTLQARAQPLTQPDVATASGNHSKNVTQTPPSAAGEGAMVTEGLADAPQEPSVWYMVLLVIAAAAVAGVVAAAVAGGDVVAEVVRLLMYMRYRLL